MTQGSRDLDLGHVTLIYSMTTICLRCIHVQSSPSCSILIHSLLMSFFLIKEGKREKTKIREKTRLGFLFHITHLYTHVTFCSILPTFSVQNKRCIAQWSILSLLSSLILFFVLLILKQSFLLIILGYTI